MARFPPFGLSSRLGRRSIPERTKRSTVAICEEARRASLIERLPVSVPSICRGCGDGGHSLPALTLTIREPTLMATADITLIHSLKTKH